MIFSLIALGASAPAMFSWPAKYTIRGTWKVPYTNLSNPITIVHEPSRQYTNQLNGVEQIWTTTKEEHLHRKIVGAGDKMICYGYSKSAADWDLELTQFLPDPAGYVAQEGLYPYNGKLCNLYVKTEVDGKTSTWKMYTDSETGYPVAYVAQAISLFYSHYDVYILEINEFIPDALYGVWSFPSICNEPDLLDDPYAGNQFNLFFPSSNDNSIHKNNELLKSRGVRHTPKFDHIDSKRWYDTIIGSRKLKNLKARPFNDVCLSTEETGKLLNFTLPSLPNGFSWRDHKPTVVGAPRDQVACGSCWAFGTAELLESQFAMLTGEFHEISVNQFMDCTWDAENYGCQGGEVNWALSSYVNKRLPIVYEKDYPYIGVSGFCGGNFSDEQIAGYVDKCYHIPRTTEAVKKALYKFGPLSIAINVVESMSLYTGGVVDDETCVGTSNDLVHAVILTGWKTIDGKEAWEVKNSWSTYWGDEGYVYIQAENQEWNCGVTTDAVAVSVTKRRPE
ncbi:Clan CA, family C1, cathepsin L-like cysteine peptidase [Histomonas meleagridis]|uniref:Clan CA, family C1, cathepsin L-like cysteine peptidase n=1 Tax=Histomonas meleagridis TaxID=135588 RepID=UPI0035596F94|nr:Clan CA, family C1, cathepsin L-like cysteine peptidase [Histomonas meleagridis]KAH0798551.1 Clan CA, family C1, cathepsin L-like cysteine peptidase [Histomonas meleagridis]